MNASLSLRTQLLHFVAWPLLLILVGDTYVSYRIGVHAANQVFDRWLLDSASSLAQEVREREGVVQFDADEIAIEVFEWDDLDRIYYQVKTVNGVLLAGTEILSQTASFEELEGGPIFADSLLESKRVRLVSKLVKSDIGRDHVIVTVAETLNKRFTLTSDLLFEVLVSKSLLFFIVLLLLAVAFGLGLKPLTRLTRELEQRSPEDMAEIDLGKTPVEIAWVIDTTNRLLSRLDTAMSGREQFIGNVAHQIRTPLAGIKLQAQLAERSDDIEEVHTSLRRISKATDQMAHLNSQLLKLARAEAASGRGLRRENVNLVSVAKYCLKSLEQLAGKTKINSILLAPKTPVIVQGEQMLLREMIGNLLENALLYGVEGGHVWLRIEEGEGYVEVTVEDDGPGIPKDTWSQIFDRFFRPNFTASDGCGLGLSIVREIALAHHATVELKDRGELSGARFVIRFTEL